MKNIEPKITAFERTMLAIKTALRSDKLDRGGCRYVHKDKHCIVGQILSNFGVSDKTLRGPKKKPFKNATVLSCRTDLEEIAEQNGLDVNLLQKTQVWWDGGSATSPTDFNALEALVLEVEKDGASVPKAMVL